MGATAGHQAMWVLPECTHISKNPLKCKNVQSNADKAPFSLKFYEQIFSIT